MSAPLLTNSRPGLALKKVIIPARLFPHGARVFDTHSHSGPISAAQRVSQPSLV